MNTKKPLFQLAETFSMTDSAFKSKNSAYEYQASYEGATYDGNDVNADVITDAAPPAVPDTGFTGITGQITQTAEDCTKAQAVYGTKMSDDAAEIDRRSKMAQPKCYDNIGPWNDNVRVMADKCADFNDSDDKLSNACQSHNPSRMECSKFTNNTDSGGMVMKKCQKPHGISSLFMFLLMIVLLVIAVLVALVFPWAWVLVALIAGYMIYSMGVGGSGGGSGGANGNGTVTSSASDSTPGFQSSQSTNTTKSTP